MFDWLRKNREVPLSGAPEVRRQKSYSGESGYVYQYYYEGRRPARRAGGPGTEHVFNVSADRKTSFPVSVFLSEAVLEEWQHAHKRELGTNERYAIAKLTLFQAFDRRDSPAAMHDEVRVEPADVTSILTTLDID
ncbi:MAG: hypothetical protein ABIZ80_07150 [Bryobacteraceae bacterium]